MCVCVCVCVCCPRLSPEAIFLDYALRSKSHDKAQEFGITFKLDVCGLYQVRGGGCGGEGGRVWRCV